MAKGSTVLDPGPGLSSFTLGSAKHLLKREVMVLVSSGGNNELPQTSWVKTTRNLLSYWRPEVQNGFHWGETKM